MCFFLFWKLSELKMEPLALVEGMKALEQEQMLWRPGVKVQFLTIFVEAWSTGVILLAPTGALIVIVCN